MADKTVLCVDDEKHVLNAIKRLLRKEDYTVLTADDGEEGLGVLDENSVQLVITDQRMPGMSGVQFLQKVKDKCPEAIRVVLSGYADAGMMLESINKGEVYRFLAKPWDDAGLKAAVQQCLDHHDILQANKDLFERARLQNDELQEMNEHLEEIIVHRTRSLLLSQEILEKLPVAVLGISRAVQLVLCNPAAREQFSILQSVIPGSSLDNVLPGDLLARVERSLAGEPSDWPFACDWLGESIQAKFALLSDGDSTRGGVLVLEKV